METVRLGVMGIGNIGRKHCTYLSKGEITNAKITAVCDLKAQPLEWARENLPESVKLYDNDEAFFASGEIDGVIISVPHYSHPPLVMEAFKNGLHALSEKPAGVYTKQVREMNEAAKKSGKVFGIMFDWRTWPLYQKLRELVQSDELGELKQNIFITTDWYRSQSYYDSGGWRATWGGEGGGILMNQAPHHLDLWQWICGVPKRIRAVCNVAKYHDIEVEDDVTAYADYEGGATGTLIASTGLTPGTLRWEITGNKAKVVVENEKISLWRLEVPERDFNRDFRGGFGEPNNSSEEVSYDQEAPKKHQGITTNWVEAILQGTDKSSLLAPGVEGIRGLEIANAAYLSSWTDGWVEIPVDEDLYYEKLQEKIKTSTFEKKGVDERTLDVEPSI
jgi:predicted dehydrogenase